MKRYPDNRTTARLLLNLALVSSVALSFPSAAASIALATEPMTTTTSSNVKPNVMFILDDSTSMDWTYLPDWAKGSTEMFAKNAAYNGIYYNPAVTYTPPVFYTATGALDTTTYPSQTGLATETGANSTTKPNWKSVKNDAYNVQFTGTTTLDGNASFYTIVPGEYCKASDLKTCVAQSAPSASYPYPAPVRWCSTSSSAGMAAPTTAGDCQAIRITGYTEVRYPQPKTATITVDTSTATATSVTSITLGAGGPQILSSPTAASTSTSTVAARIRDSINACSAAMTNACTVAGFSATVSSGDTVIISGNGPGAIATPVIAKTGSKTFTISSFSGGNSVPGSTRYIDIIPSIPNYPYPGTTVKAPMRSDCAGTTCTYTEEMTNFANWWTYYHSRMQAMKTSVSRAFKSLDNRFRVGFTSISEPTAVEGTKFLGNQTFELAHKRNWFTKLFASDPSPSGATYYTPLRGALSKAGRYYAHKITSIDPIQYSCQQNFTILSTDGYWNTNHEVSGDDTDSYGPDDLQCKDVGNLDSAATTQRPMREGTTEVSNTLADVAKYYYETDLRTDDLENCHGGISTNYPSGNPDVCKNNVFTSSTDKNVEQHMTTFTMGLGIDGTLNFTDDYAEATSGDFFKLKNGEGSPPVNWPDPIANEKEARIDDLWHAAINGRGTYFSAKNPDQIVSGFTKALSSLTSKLGSSAAAATSTLNPVAGNNYAYVASYTTVKWTGNLEARSINTTNGAVSDTATWCVENVLVGSCTGTIVPATEGSSTIYNCVTTGETADSCISPAVFDGNETCTKEIARSCTGTLPTKVAASTDTRTILTANDAGTGLIPFDTAYATAHSTYFDATHVNGLSQWAAISGLHTPAKLLSYLRGQTGYEKRTSNPIADRLYRTREAVLGDALESQPAFISKPIFNYSYPGYDAFKAAQSGRAGTVYMGTNDGMMHAFDANTGVERWAYVPSMVIPNLWRLASDDYSTHHVNYVNGSAVISDVYGTFGTSTGWRTILVAGLNGGGRGYYALDITDPASPALLWEFTPSTGIGKLKDDNLGYTFGRPVITRKKSDGKWVVLVTSGYNNGTLSSDPLVNNSPTGNGLGYLYVIDAASGTFIDKYATSAGSPTNPSGLAQIAAWNNEAGGNEVGKTYGGDLQGNLWRFDVNEAAAIGSNPLKFATLHDGSTAQPITTTPVLGLVKKKPVVYVATGQYLEISDLSTSQVQTLYAIKDDNATTPLTNPRGGAPNRMVRQTITVNGNIREGSTNEVDMISDRGWYIDFPDSSTGSERANIDSKLVSGTLIVPTIVPSSTACSPGGWGWLSYFNYENGWPVRDNNTNVNVSVKYDSTIVGVNVIYIHGEPVVEVVTSNDPNPKVDENALFKLSPADFSGHRSVWRELIPN